MNWVDTVIIAIVASAALIGAVRGLLVEVGAIVGALLGSYIAGVYYPRAANVLGLYFPKDRHLSAVAFVLLFLLVWSLVVFAAGFLSTAAKLTPFGPLNSLGGLVLGAVIGVIAVDVLILVALRTHDTSLVTSIHGSSWAHFIRNHLPGLPSLIPRGIRPPG